jgi:hypothetical protein
MRGSELRQQRKNRTPTKEGLDLEEMEMQLAIEEYKDKW